MSTRCRLARSVAVCVNGAEWKIRRWLSTIQIIDFGFQVHFSRRYKYVLLNTYISSIRVWGPFRLNENHFSNLYNYVFTKPCVKLY